MPEAPPKRECNPTQEAAVLRIRKCSPTAFYDILDLESVKTSVTETEIKKAYRKLSLLTHPDKNGHEHADEAFKMVNRAFGVLGDKEKRDKFDRYGTDPDSRFASAQAQNPFSGFARQRPGGGGFPGAGGARGMWEDEISPEEMFQRFFGGMGGGGGGFGGPFGGGFDGPQFMFNMGGGPGIRVHQFNGGRPRGRPRAAQDEAQAGHSTLSTIISLLPILVFFILPVLQSLFSGGSTTPSNGAGIPRMVYDNPQTPYTQLRTTEKLNVHYYVNPADVAAFSTAKLAALDRTAENNLLRYLRIECEREVTEQQRLREAARGWLAIDKDKKRVADEYVKPSCDRLDRYHVSR